MTNLRHVLLALLVSSVGCATPMTEMRDDNRHLNQTVDELRAERREQTRKLEDLEHQLTAMRVHTMTAAGTIEGEPTLPVVVAAPPAASSTGAATADLAAGQRLIGVADDGAEIVYEGDAAAGKAGMLDDDDAANALGAQPLAPAPSHARASRVDHDRDRAPEPITVVGTADRLEVTRHVPNVPIAARATRSHVRADGHDVAGERTAPSGDPAAEYRAAVAQLKAGDHDGAIAALRAFIAHYPHHDYADNAQYWLGEAFYVQRDFTRALVEFRATIETYPRGNKVPDALLKVGYCYSAMGQDAKARAVLEQVVNLYPKSEPSVLAAKRLETP